jgi:EF hand domain-containing protein
MTLHLSLHRAAIVAAVCVAGVSTASAQNRSQFRALDRDGNGVITRAEWRGSERSFLNHDRNRDGVITREEWRITEYRSATARTSQDFDLLDRGGDQRLTRYEWQSAYGDFDTIDRNGDGVVTRAEFLATREPAPAAYNPYSQEGRYNEGRQGPGARAYQAGRERGLEEGRFAGRDDRNRGRWDLDGQRELLRADSGYRSDVGDHDIYQAGYREGFILGYREAFGRQAPPEGRAYQAGRAQGMVDGRRAGREDADRNHWDFEGQRELVMADGGYREGVGSRSEYEWGYREGFRVGYEQGFGPQR